MKYKILTFFLILSLFPTLGQAQTQAAVVIDIAFPVQGGAEYIDDFGAPRFNHSHEGNDLMAPKHTPVIAANDGVVSWAPIPEPSYGWGIWIKGDDGYTYVYIHLNNDTPGTDDGNGGVEHAYADGVRQGSRVTRGQIIGWVGDSGNAESANPHVHFEIRDTKTDVAIDPYPSLQAAEGNIPQLELNFDPEQASALAPTINHELGIHEATTAAANCESDTLIKSPSTTAVYYCGANGKRYVFSTSGTYFSWYNNFDSVLTITEEELASIPLGGNVTYRPGVRMLKIQSDPKVYAVDTNGTLRWVTTAVIAEELYGTNWNKSIDDISETYFINYQTGEDILYE